MEIHIDNGLNEMLFPFSKYWKPKKCIISTKLVGFEQWETDVVFFAGDDSILNIPESDEIQKIVDLWDECCLSDLISNRLITHIFQNMVHFGNPVVTIRLNF